MRGRAERVCVTGLGGISALGGTLPRSFARLCAGETGIGPLTAFDVGGQRGQLSAEVGELAANLRAFEAREDWSRSDILALAAAREAIASAGLTGSLSDTALVVGGTTGGMREAETLLAGDPQRLSQSAARRLLSYPLSTSAEQLMQALGTGSSGASLCSACSSGANALALGAGSIASGRTARALCGGTDALCRLTFSGFNALGVMAPEACRPFDVQRTGLVLGEGAAFIVLESETEARRRGARILAWLDGWSVGAEAHHITHPEPSAETAARLLMRALRRGGVEIAELDYVNAHGTATAQNDAAEARAFARAFGDDVARIYVSSSKGQVGHTLGAAGALEAAFTVMAIDAGMAPPTGGLVTPDPELHLRHVMGRAVPVAIRTAVSTSFGFGGAGTVLLFSHPDRELTQARETNIPLRVVSVATLSAVGVRRDQDVLSRADMKAVEPQRPWVESLEAARSRRFDPASAMMTVGAGETLREVARPDKEVGLVAGSAYGNVERSVAFLQRLFRQGPRFASPADFPHLVPSAAVGNASIYHQLVGPVLAVADLMTSAESAFAVALSLLEDEQADAIVSASVEPRDGVVERVLGPLCLDQPPEGTRRGEGGSFVLLARGREPGGVEVVYWSDAAQPGSLPIPAGARSVVVRSGGAENEAFVAASGWRGVRSIAPAMDGIPHEARGGFALAHAVALLFAGEADEALVAAVGKGKSYAFVFKRENLGDGNG